MDNAAGHRRLAAASPARKSSEKRTSGTYNLRTLFLQKTLRLALALIVVVFVSFYPYLGTVGICEDGGCPQASQASQAHVSGPGTAAGHEDNAVAVLAGSVTALAVLGLVVLRRAGESRPPAEPYLSPVYRPPRTSPVF